ncbi:f-box containing protein [Fusarium austroafricanum]|uniref:F-box containing protein n=1 Tax=Fusarium austroafricanum TaxID=2364996 RepID=A0A8H4KIN5_9HYPO|nr:f-box containing protein [Fusarium austroafricanum]
MASGSISTTDLASDQRRPSTAPPSCDNEMTGLSERSDSRDWSSRLSCVTWPKNEIPVEIFEIIISYLTRLEVRCLRLVCKEFEDKVSAQYFRNVVVPFKSELYSKLDRDENGALKRTSSALLSNGMRIFQSFGIHIRRFALSLELDEETLSYPPVKPSQEAVPSFWGIYRWPHGTYHRYTDLEGLEQTADETEAMKEALKCLVEVTNLGLCCDAGLGFLSGPDHIARSATTLHPVFATQNWRHTGSDSQARKQPIITMSDLNEMVKDFKKPVFENPISFKRTVLQKMASDAGYSGAQVNEAVLMMLETEGTNLNMIDFDERTSILSEMEARRSLTQTTHRADFEPVVAEVANHPLIPSSLTRAQKEMLLELEWAHRAMIQSYVIGLIDNARDDCFSNLTTITIAKVPSSHVYILYRDELWQNLPSLNNVSLGVIADWRRVSKPAPGCVEDTSISPVEAVGKVYQLLNKYIGAQRNIESLHFEWICGGEFAPGTYQRNHYILPAPFFEQPQLMTWVDSPKTHQDDLLTLPFIKHLSLKNCWASPHVFLQTIRSMALSKLEKLNLESVSLSGPPTLTPQAPLQQVGAPNGNTAHLLGLILLPGQPPGQLLPGQQPPANGQWAMPLQFGQLNQLPQQNAQTNQPQANNQVPGQAPTPSDVLQQPEVLSWAGIIEHFSPSIKIKDILTARDESASTITSQPAFDQPDPLGQHIPCPYRLRSDEKSYTLKCLSFKSCGYVSVDVPALNTRSILPHGVQGLGANGNPHSQDMSPLMQKSRDKLLGRIAPCLRNPELFQLTNAFGMDMGWENVYDERTISDAVADGVEHPGRGRFSGTVDAASLPGARNSEAMVTLDF